MYHFDISLDGKAVNEQWNDTAQMFVTAAEAMETAYMLSVGSGDPVTVKSANPRRLWEAARLYELAADAYYHAQATTFGHKKSDRYEECRTAARTKAAMLYQDFKSARDAKGVWFGSTIPAWAEVATTQQ